MSEPTMNRTMPSGGGGAQVSVFTADQVMTIAPDATLQAAAQELAEDSVGMLVVGSVDKVLGVISERDIVRAVAAFRDPRTTLVSDIESTRLVWCDASATVNEVAEQMMEQYVRHVLVEEDGRLLGVVSARDLLGAYAIG